MGAGAGAVRTRRRLRLSHHHDELELDSRPCNRFCPRAELSLPLSSRAAHGPLALAVAVLYFSRCSSRDRPPAPTRPARD